ncbi:hypothetical protein DH2020_042292 [Rehmannia glutinosa]|uniref:Subtilisin-like protease n=1 Tax=Rehmannia glutinosa TaxID=99300 RepID=A0ABR0UMX8_REHGL
MEEVVSVFRSDPGKYTVHTTRSWEFAGLQESRKWNNIMEKKDDLLLKSRYGKNVVVGMLDNGIFLNGWTHDDDLDFAKFNPIVNVACVWPESQSFSDKGMGPIPKSWKGICQSGDAFNSSHCNKSFYIVESLKESRKSQCPSLDLEDYRGPILHQGLRIILRPTEQNTRFPLPSRQRRARDPHIVDGRRPEGQKRLRRGRLRFRHRLRRRAAGSPGHLQSVLGDSRQGKEDGNTCFEEDMLAAIDDAIADGVDVLSISIGTANPTPFDQDGIAIGALHAVKRNVVVACSAGNSGPAPATLSNPAPWIITVGASSVDRIFLSPVVLGNGVKITAMLTRVGKGMEVKRAGGIGFILGNSKANGNELAADAHLLPATAVSYENGIRILKYINSSKAPKAYIVPAKTILDSKPAPFMAAFSSRGPSTISPDILKPDITAPGLNILAAWSEASSPTKLSEDNRVVKYNILSGTSMSCPHIGGASALLKAIHPDWSSAAIRSAIVTSAGLRNNEGNPITDASGNPADPFQFGSGHFRPTKAADPGLVYDASYKDYLLFLCSSGFKNLSSSFKCPKNSPSPGNLNYPSLAIPKLSGSVTVVRTVTNVGSSKSVYFVSTKPPPGISVKISPPILYFNRAGQPRSFTITVKTESEITGTTEKDKYEFGWYTWSDGIHNVRSPMAISVA